MTKYYIMRLQSSRGTDMCFCLKFPAKTSKEDVRTAMEFFAEKQTAGTACHEYTVSYKQVKMRPRNILIKQHNIALKSREALEDFFGFWGII